MLREGIRPEKKILICLPASVDLAGIILACFEVGAIAVPISHMITKDESKYIIDRIQPDYIVTNWTMQDIFGKYSAVQFFIEEFINSSSGCGLVKNSYIRNLKKNQLNVYMGLYVCYSGTDGKNKKYKPKGKTIGNTNNTYLLEKS